MARVLVLVAGWWLLLLLVFSAAAHFLPAQPDEIAFTTNHEPQIESAMRSPGASTVRWDAYYYLHIAAHGYRADEPRDFGFFPLFPLAVVGLHRLGLPLIAAGLLLNFFAVVFAAFFLCYLAIDYCGDGARAERAVLLFLIFPSAYFLAAWYAEALFCALGFGAFYFARQRRWLAANLLLALLTATRPPAFCFALGVFAEFVSAMLKRDRSTPSRVAALSFLLAPAGLVAHLAYLHYRWGDVLLYTHSLAKYWQHTHFSANLLRPLWTTAGSAAAFAHFGLWTEAIHLYTALGCMLLAILVLVRGAGKLPIGHTVLMASTVVLLLSSGTLVSAHRNILPLFPIYIVLADELSRWRLRALLAISAALMTFLLAAFVQFRFTG